MRRFNYLDSMSYDAIRHSNNNINGETIQTKINYVKSKAKNQHKPAQEACKAKVQVA